MMAANTPAQMLVQAAKKALSQAELTLSLEQRLIALEEIIAEQAHRITSIETKPVKAKAIRLSKADRCVLEALRLNPDARQVDLVTITGLTKGTVSKAVKKIALLG